jgi:nickel transport protein
MSAARIVVASLLCVCAASAAQAHSLNLFVREEAGAVKGSAYFTGGVPAKSIEVQVFAGGDQPVATVTTGDDGNFTYAAAAGRALRFVASTPDGHRAEAKLEGAGGVAPSAPANLVAAPENTTNLEREIGAVQTALDRLEHKLWLRDVIGGIGYIFGLAGFWALWKARSKGARH